jgi:hypothetical protein
VAVVRGLNCSVRAKDKRETREASSGSDVACNLLLASPTEGRGDKPAYAKQPPVHVY